MPTALVIGASGTLGGAIAAELMARGYSVGLHCRSRVEICEALRASALERGQQAEIFRADVTCLDDMNALAAAFLKRFERMDACVWAAGTIRNAPLALQDEADLRAVLNVDLKGFFLLLKVLSRQFMRQKSGALLALTSHAGISGRRGGAAYAMAQSGLTALVKSAAREWGSLGVRVNAIAPPFIRESGMGGLTPPESADAIERKRVLKSDPEALRNFARYAADVLGNATLSGQVIVGDSRIV